MVVKVVLALRRYDVHMVAVWKSLDDGLIAHANSGSMDEDGARFQTCAPGNVPWEIYERNVFPDDGGSVFSALYRVLKTPYV